MRIILAEDQPLILKSLDLLLSEEKDIEVVGTAKQGREALELCRIMRPHVAVLDMRMPVMSGLEVAKQLKKEDAKIPILLLTTFDEEATIREALRVGVEGFLLKDVDPAMFITALRAIAGGLIVFHPVVRPYCVGTQSLEPLKKAKPLEYGLTAKDLDVINAIVQGLGNKEIADREGCTEGTIKNRVSSILNKMGLSARTQIAVSALREDLI